MTGKGYYITTIGDWKRRAGTFANSHWLLLDDPGNGASGAESEGSQGAGVATGIEQLDEAARILVLVEADEGMHGALEDDGAFEALPHPLSNKPISDGAQAALAAHGVRSGASTFEATEILARVHPLLRHRVF
jgi:hypothetical protein